MKKNSKFIAFICAMAMILSMFGSFTIVNAEAEPGMGLESSLSEDGKTITVVAKYINPDEADPGIRSFNVTINVPDTATAVTAEPIHKAGLAGEQNFKEEEKLFVINGALSKGATSEDDVIAVITIELSEPLASDFEIALQTGSMMELGTNGAKLRLAQNTLPAASTTVDKWVDPNATEAPTDPPTPKPAYPRPTAAVTEEPTESDAPAPTREPVVVEKGITLDAAVSEDAKTITVTARYVNPDEADPGIRSFNVTINVPDTATAVTAEPIHKAGLAGEQNFKEEEKLFVINGALSKGATSEDDVIAVITIELSEPLASDFEIALQTGSMMELGTNGDKLRLAQNTLPAAFTVASAPKAEPTPTDKPTPKPASTDVKLSDLIKVPAGTELTDDAYITVDIKKADGTPAKYGEDYVAVDKDGNELTEAEFINMISGHTDADIKDVINNITIKAYETTKIVSAALNDNGVVVDEGEKDVEKTETPTDAPTSAPTNKPTSEPTDKPTSKPTDKPTGGSGSNRGGVSGQIASGNVVGTGSASDGVYTQTKFQDLGNVPWAVAAINRLASLGVINGRSETIFDPEATVTRAEFAKMVCNAFGITANTGNKQTFTDVTLSDWYYAPVEAAAAAGVINGVSDTEFAPNDLITREQMAAMMYRAITYKNVPIQTGAIRDFTDAWNISEYAVGPVNTLSAAGIINGMDDGSFAPKASATRAQAACIIYQYFASIGA